MALARVTIVGPAKATIPPLALTLALASTHRRAPGRASPPLKEKLLLVGSRNVVVFGVPMANSRPPASIRAPRPMMMLFWDMNQMLPPTALPTLPSIIPSIRDSWRPMILFRTIQLRAPKL